MARARRTAAPTAPTYLMPTMYSVMWDDVFLSSNTVSYEHKSLTLDKPFCCLLKCLWKAVGEGSKYYGTPQMHWLDVGRVGGFCRITARVGWGESRASSRPAVPCESTRVSCFLNRWLILLSPATTAVIRSTVTTAKDRWKIIKYF